MSLDRIQKFMDRLVNWLDATSINIAAVLLVVIVVLDGSSVFFRYVLGDALSWSEEVMRYSNVWLSFIGAIAAFARREHMTVDLGLTSLGAFGRVLQVIGLVITLIVAGYMVFVGGRGAIANLAQTSPSAGLPMAIPYAAIPVAGVGIFIVSFCFLIFNLRQVEFRLPQESQE